MMRRTIKWRSRHKKEWKTGETCEGRRCLSAVWSAEGNAPRKYHVHYTRECGRCVRAIRDTNIKSWKTEFIRKCSSTLLLQEKLSPPTEGRRERWFLSFVIQLHKQLAVASGICGPVCITIAHRSRGISSCGVSCCSSVWTWCCTPHTWRASFQCVWPCGPAEHSFGWRPCHTACTWRAARLQENTQEPADDL